MKFLYLVISFLLVGCVGFFEESPDYIKAANHTMNQHAKLMDKEGISLFGSGGRMTSNVERFDLFYQKKEFVDIARARELEVKAIESLLRLANSDLWLRPYMDCYPFTDNNVALSILFVDKNTKIISPPYVAHVLLCNGKIYYTSNPDPKEPLQDLYEEDYEEAKKIVFGTSS